MKSINFFAALAAAGLSIPATADAALLQFTLSGTYNNSFQLDSDPVPDIALTGVGFTLFDVPVPGTLADSAELTFFGPLFGGGLNITDAVTLDTLFLGFASSPLYSGSANAPTFVPGIYELINLDDFTLANLTITPLGAAVPEPQSWALLVAGFGVIGGGLRMRRRARVG